MQHVSTATAGPFLPNSVGVAIRPAILEAAGAAPIIVKHHADAFQETALLDHLAGTRTLLIAGMMTQNCFVFTALSRSADAFPVQVAGDLCAAPSEIVHRVARTALASKLPVADAAQLWP